MTKKLIQTTEKRIDATLAFDPLVRELRRNVLYILAQFPTELGAVVREHYMRRVQNYNAFEQGPWLIADLLGVDASDRLRSLAPYWFLVHLYTLLVDDSIDSGEESTAPLVIGAGLCVCRGLSVLCTELPQLARAGVFTEFFDETATAAFEECDKALTSRLSADSLHKKMAITKVWASVVLACSGLSREEVTERLAIIDAVMNAMQLRDDLIDWEEDLSSARMTPLLRRAFGSLSQGENGARPLATPSGPEEVCLVLVMSGAFEENIILSSNYFSTALRIVPAAGEIAREYVLERLRENDRALQKVRTLRRSFLADTEASFGTVGNLEALLALRELIQTTWGAYGCR